MTYKERYSMKENSISEGDKKSAPAFTGAPLKYKLLTLRSQYKFLPLLHRRSWRSYHR